MSAESQARPASATKSTYWPGLDGMRACAVVSVMLFHLNRPEAKGGYRGVDVFFVVSGFLITDLLLR